MPDYYIDSSGNEFRIITDHLGSVRMIVNADTGAVSQYMEHDEFGNILQDTNPGVTPFGFAGGLYTQESGLVRFGARDYDSLAGRWLSKDPIGFGGGDANLYGYVIQDPVNFIDPLGLWAWPPSVYDGAVKETRERYPSGGHNDVADAFRHCMASCTMTQENGFMVSWATGTANEVKADFKGQPKCENIMDTHNNAFGSYLGQSSGSCAERCASAASQGLLMTLR